MRKNRIENKDEIWNGFSKEEELFNSLTHIVGFLFSIAALVVLVVLASLEGNVWKIVSFSIYGATLIILYGISTLYHSVKGRRKKLFQRLDHISIYLLIAGSYTPFTLVSMRGGWGWSIFGVIWGLAIFGIVQEFFVKNPKRILSLIIYIVMGWLILVAVVPLIKSLPAGGLAWLVIGGLFYTGGVYFFINDEKIRHFHGIWHLFVMAGSISHFFTIAFYVL
ncbi:MAG: hemolysin III family protein [Campylobacteraceae bacterium]|jgi:hemolysin III|nr:hemolysin III family protein [Campylobacteraceae bacterium]